MKSEPSTIDDWIPSDAGTAFLAERDQHSLAIQRQVGHVIVLYHPPRQRPAFAVVIQAQDRIIRSHVVGSVRGTPIRVVQRKNIGGVAVL